MRRLIVVGALLALSTAAFGQVGAMMPDTINTTDREVYLPNSQENLNAQQVREGMVRFARCVAGRRFREANAFVLVVSEATWNTLSKKVDSDCVLDAVQNPSGEVRLSSNSQDMLFALAEVLVQKRTSALDPVQLALTGPLPRADPLMTVGECAVRANATGARNLLKTKLNSKDELQAVNAMTPAFAGCLPKGLQFRPNLTTLRGMVAVNYYRLANAPKVQSKGERGS